MIILDLNTILLNIFYTSISWIIKDLNSKNLSIKLNRNTTMALLKNKAASAKDFYLYLQESKSRQVMVRYGFIAP